MNDAGFWVELNQGTELPIETLAEQSTNWCRQFPDPALEEIATVWKLEVPRLDTE